MIDMSKKVELSRAASSRTILKGHLIPHRSEEKDSKPLRLDHSKKRTTVLQRDARLWIGELPMNPENTARTQTRQLQGWAVLSIEGQIDFCSSPDIRKELLPLVGHATPRVAIDLTGVDYIDSSGVATFIEALQRVKKVGGQLVLLGLCDAVRHVFEIVRLKSVFSIYRSKEELWDIGVINPTEFMGLSGQRFGWA
jgi:anti-sigma B factor antagonist